MDLYINKTIIYIYIYISYTFVLHRKHFLTKSLTFLQLILKDSPLQFCCPMRWNTSVCICIYINYFSSQAHKVPQGSRTELSFKYHYFLK